MVPDLSLRNSLKALAVLILIAVIVVALVLSGIVPPTTILGTPEEYEQATVTFTDGEGEVTGAVDARVADTYLKQYVGLSNTEHLPNGSGMLFVYDEESDHEFVMREMSYPLDFVFIGADHRVTSIASAPAPTAGEDGTQITRSGTSKFVLEIPRGWADRQGVSAGSHVRINRSNSTS